VTAPRHTITLTSTGAKTGKRRRATLYAFEDAERLVIVGSLGGSARNPQWVHNLRAHPAVSVKVGKETTEMVAAEVLTHADRDRLWQLVVEAFPLYASYQQRTKRTIPLFTLSRP
jgi:deazaflavin-dependent oxidoreductase (nitroreductase family)